MKRLFFMMTALLMASSVAFASVSAAAPSSPSKVASGTAVYNAVWTGATVTTYTATPYTGLSAEYTDVNGITRGTYLTFVKGSEVITSPNYPVDAGVYTVTARASMAGDSVDALTATTTLTILPATVSVENAIVVITKYYDGNRSAEVKNIGTLKGVLANDVLSHSVVANFEDSRVGFNKNVYVDFAIDGPAAANYQLNTTRKIDPNGAIIDYMLPDPAYGGTDVNQGIDVAAYGYCSGNGTIEYHLLSGQPDQYRIKFDDPAFADVYWSYLDTPGTNGTIDINIPVGVKTGDYTATLLFRNHNCPALQSAPIPISFHVNLPETYVMPLFNDVIAVIDTCHCLSDFQWYHRENATDEWKAIEGANDRYYRQEGGLTGEYFVGCKMDGVATFTCPQDDMGTLVRDNAEAKVSAYPNPTAGSVSISFEGATTVTHTLRILNAAGVEILSQEFVGNLTSVDLSGFQHGTYIVIVDDVVTRVIKN